MTLYEVVNIHNYLCPNTKGGGQPPVDYYSVKTPCTTDLNFETYDLYT